MKISVIVTVFNEEETISGLLKSLAAQTLKPNEVVTVDGGSLDGTLKKIKNWKANHKKLRLKVLSKKGNRSTCRNLAIKKAINTWIAITDAGCVPQKSWLENLMKKQRASKAPVIAGYYFGLPQTSFEKAVVPYVLIMPDKVNKGDFLPATRSMLLNKKAWEEIGGFDERLDHNEDYAFAKKLEKEKIEIAFAKNALVGWLPRKNLRSFGEMIFRFAYGDIEAGILRPKVLTMFSRYLVFLYLLIEGPDFLVTAVFSSYLAWSIWKNKKYVEDGWVWLPALQIASDLAVMLGSLLGAVKFLLKKLDQK